MDTVRRQLGRIGLPLVDQALYSASNLAITILVARVADVREFGIFALVYAAVVVLQGTVDGLVCEPFSVVHSEEHGKAARADLGRASGASILLGVAASLLMAVVGLAVGGHTQSLLVAYALVLPALLVQSFWRFACFALDRPETAVANDVVWVGVQVVALAVVILGGWSTPTNLVLAWGAGAAAAAVFGCWQLGVIPEPTAGVTWLRSTAGLGVRYAAEFLATFGASQAALSVTGAIAGLGAVAQLRGAQVAYGPVATLANGVRVAGTPIAVRARARGFERLRRVSLVIGGGLVVVVVLWTALVLAIPEGVGEAVIGDSWEPAREVVPAIGVNALATAWAAGLLVSLRAVADARRSLRGRAATGVLRLAGAAVGAVVAGGEGAAWGLATGAILGLGVLHAQYREALRDQLPSR